MAGRAVAEGGAVSLFIESHWCCMLHADMLKTCVFVLAENGGEFAVQKYSQHYTSGFYRLLRTLFRSIHIKFASVL